MIMGLLRTFCLTIQGNLNTPPHFPRSSEEQRSADLQDLSVSYSDNYNPMSPTNCDPMNYDSTHSLPVSIRNRPPLESSQSVVENEEQGSGETFTGDTNSLPRSRKRQRYVTVGHRNSIAHVYLRLCPLVITAFYVLSAHDVLSAHPLL